MFDNKYKGKELVVGHLVAFGVLFSEKKEQ